MNQATLKNPAGKFLPLEWLKHFIPQHSDIQKKIFAEWVKRISLYTSELNLPPQESDEILKQKIFAYFFPHVSTMRSPFELPDMKKAVSVLREYYENKERTIVFYGDRDADGVSSVAILYLFFRDQLKYPEEKLVPLVPREEDKYGITDEVAARILTYEPELLITLDCGSSNQQEIKSLCERCHQKENPLQTIVIDHHFIPENEEDYPQVDAFINPKRLPTEDPNRELCTAGLAYKLIWALTYSFTREYDKNYQISYTDSPEKYSIYFKNLIQNYDGEARQIINEFSLDSQKEEKPSLAQESELIDFSPLWDKMTASNSFFDRIQTFLSSSCFSIDPADRARFVFQANLKNISEKTSRYLIFSAIGSVADMVPLIDDNRIIVTEGLRIMNKNFKSSSPSHPSIEGVMALARALLSQQDQVYEEDLSFSICPAINAAGRLGKASASLASLLESDRLLSAKKAFEIKKINQERKNISKRAMELILPSLEESTLEKKMVIVYSPEIHRGISGLLANRLCEHFKKPALVLVDDGDSIRGSIRSSQNQNVFSFLVQLKHFFIQFGGHKQAAGFSLDKNEKENFIRASEELAESFFSENPPDKSPETRVNAEHNENEDEDEFFEAFPIHDHEITTSLWDECRVFAPFGKKNPNPVLAIKLTQPVVCESLGSTGDHAKIKFPALRNHLIEGIWFFHNGGIKKLTEEPPPESSKTLIAEPSINDWRGRKTYRLKIKKLV